MNFALSCGQVLQKYDLERDYAREEARAKFDLERDEALRKFIASMMGVKLTDAPKTPKQPSDTQKQTMTRQDIMRNYAR